MFTVSHFQSDFSSGNYSEHNPRTPAGHEQVGKNRIYSSDLNHVTTDGRADAAPPKPDTIQCRSELRGFFSFSFHLSINFSFSVFAHDRNLHTMTQQVALLLCFRFCRPRCALTLHSVIYIHTYNINLQANQRLSSALIPPVTQGNSLFADHNLESVQSPRHGNHAWCSVLEARRVPPLSLLQLAVLMGCSGCERFQWWRKRYDQRKRVVGFVPFDEWLILGLRAQRKKDAERSSPVGSADTYRICRRSLRDRQMPKGDNVSNSKTKTRAFLGTRLVKHSNYY